MMPCSETWFEFDLAPMLPTSSRCFSLSILSDHICYMGSYREGKRVRSMQWCYVLESSQSHMRTPPRGQ